MQTVLKSGSLEFLEPSGPVQACVGITFTNYEDYITLTIGKRAWIIAGTTLVREIPRTKSICPGVTSRTTNPTIICPESSYGLGGEMDDKLLSHGTSPAGIYVFQAYHTLSHSAV
jgi:hypothetical protein